MQHLTTEKQYTSRSCGPGYKADQTFCHYVNLVTSVLRAVRADSCQARTPTRMTETNIYFLSCGSPPYQSACPMTWHISTLCCQKPCLTHNTPSLCHSTLNTATQKPS
jgi:hypothetical protein